MIIEVRNADNNEVITQIKARSNTKDIHGKVKKELSKMIGHDVRLLMQGSIDMATGKFSGHYLTLGTFEGVDKITYSVLN